VTIETSSQPSASAKPRVLKQPAIRRAELIDCAEQLFMAKGYERTTISDVIDATGLSKGAFYHHFRAKEDLLEAIAERFARQAIDAIMVVQGDERLNALERLNAVLTLSREWKVEHLPELKAMFTSMLRPENARLYHRIVDAVFGAMAPSLTQMIAEGAVEGVFNVADAQLAAEALLWLGEGRRALLVQAMQMADAGQLDQGAEMLLRRLRAEEAMIDRVLGLPTASVQLVGSLDDLKTIMAAWVATPAVAVAS
jgi:AcrR family transcriptional regulator